jgi:hypothetical protein
MQRKNAVQEQPPAKAKQQRHVLQQLPAPAPALLHPLNA